MQQPHVIDLRPARVAGRSLLAANDPRVPRDAAAEFHALNDRRALELQAAAQVRTEWRS
jgi:hypothetical protein